MNTATLESPGSFEVPFRNFALSAAEVPVPLLLSRRDASTAPLRRAAEERKARIAQNGALSDSQKCNALEMLRQQTEVEMRRALGDRNFHAFKAFNQWWFRELSAGDQINGKQTNAIARGRWPEQTSVDDEPNLAPCIPPGDETNSAERCGHDCDVRHGIFDNNTTR